MKIMSERERVKFWQWDSAEIINRARNNISSINRRSQSDLIINCGLLTSLLLVLIIVAIIEN